MEKKINTIEPSAPEKAGVRENPYTTNKILGAALLGALAGVFFYFVYNQMGDDTQKVVKEAMVTGVKAQMARLAVSAISD